MCGYDWNSAMSGQLCCTLRKRCTSRQICSKLSMISRQLFAPVTTIFPDTKIRKAILGTFSRYTRPGNNSGMNWISAVSTFLEMWSSSSFSRWMGNFTSAEATTFWILNSEYRTAKPIFSMILAYLRLASWHSSSERAPVITIFPLLKIRPVVLGLRRRMMTAANRLGLYSVALPFQVISFRSNLHPRFTVPTTFWMRGWHCSGTFRLRFSVRAIILLQSRQHPLQTPRPTPNHPQRPALPSNSGVSSADQQKRRQKEVEKSLFLPPQPPHHELVREEGHAVHRERPQQGDAQSLEEGPVALRPILLHSAVPGTPPFQPLQILGLHEGLHVVHGVGQQPGVAARQSARQEGSHDRRLARPLPFRREKTHDVLVRVKINCVGFDFPQQSGVKTQVESPQSEFAVDLPPRVHGTPVSAAHFLLHEDSSMIGWSLHELQSYNRQSADHAREHSAQENVAHRHNATLDYPAPALVVGDGLLEQLVRAERHRSLDAIAEQRGESAWVRAAVPLQKERSPSSRRMRLKQCKMPKYSGLSRDWLTSRTLMISKGCMTNTCAQPEMPPQTKPLMRSSDSAISSLLRNLILIIVMDQWMAISPGVQQPLPNLGLNCSATSDCMGVGRGCVGGVRKEVCEQVRAILVCCFVDMMNIHCGEQLIDQQRVTEMNMGDVRMSKTDLQMLVGVGKVIIRFVWKNIEMIEVHKLNDSY